MWSRYKHSTTSKPNSRFSYIMVMGGWLGRFSYIMVMNEVHYINKVNEKTKPEEQLRTIVLTLNIGNNDNGCTKK